MITVFPPQLDHSPPPKVYNHSLQLHLDGVMYLSMSISGFDAIPDDYFWGWFGDNDNRRR